MCGIVTVLGQYSADGKYATELQRITGAQSDGEGATFIGVIFEIKLMGGVRNGILRRGEEVHVGMLLRRENEKAKLMRYGAMMEKSGAMRGWIH